MQIKEYKSMKRVINIKVKSLQYMRLHLIELDS